MFRAEDGEQQQNGGFINRVDFWTEQTLQNLAKRLTKWGKVRLTYFERELVKNSPLAPAMDSMGNLDLNVAANIANQRGPATRIQPNVLVGASPEANNSFVRKSRGANTVQSPMNKAEEISAKAVCARLHQRNGQDVQGLTNCRYCKGIGFISAELQKAGKISNQPRENIDGAIIEE
jgi:hypothetical protein